MAQSKRADTMPSRQLFGVKADMAIRERRGS